MKTVIVLVMHGVPPKDFPPQELAEFFTLSGRLRRAAGEEKNQVLQRYAVLEQKMRNWPRTAQNDPFYTASRELAAELSETTGFETTVGYNEFCAPSVEEVLERAAAAEASKIIVLTPMMTRGGEHAEVEIPALVKQFEKAHPLIQIVYAWPYDKRRVARFLADHVADFL